MPQSPNLGWVFPANEQDPWFDIFVSLLGSMDSDVYAVLEYQRTVLCTTGTFSMDYGTNTFSWTENLEFISMITGQIATFFGGGTISLPEGTILWVVIPRPMVAPVTIGTIMSGNTMTPSRQNQLLAVRRNGKTYIPLLGEII